MSHRGGQFYMPHALPAHLGESNLYATPITANTLVAYLLIFPAVAFEVLGGSKDPFAKKSVSLWFQTTVIYSLRLCYLTPRPVFDLLW